MIDTRDYLLITVGLACVFVVALFVGLAVRAGLDAYALALGL